MPGATSAQPAQFNTYVIASQLQFALDSSGNPGHRLPVVSGDSILYPGEPVATSLALRDWQGEIMTKSWKYAGALLALAYGIAGSISTVRADEPDTYSSVQDLEKARKQRVASSQNIWWERLIPGRMEEKRKAAEEAKAQIASVRKKKAEEADAPKKEVNTRQAELAKALRREAVCQRLREIAEDTNDPELAKQADLLESRAWAVYEQKVSTASVARFQPMSDKDAESRLTRSTQNTASDTARLETDNIRSIRGEKKE